MMESTSIPTVPSASATQCTFAPVVTRTGGRIIISGLPAPFDARRLDESAILRIVHEFKHLFTHGTRKGKTESDRRRSKKKPLDNDVFTLPIAYTSIIDPNCTDGTVRLIIDIIRSTAAKATIRKTIPTPPTIPDPSPDAEPANTLILPGYQSTPALQVHMHKDWLRQDPPKKPPKIRKGFREMTEQEAENFFDACCEQCAQEIQDYLNRIFDEAATTGNTPDYYCGTTTAPQL